jgi:hypothetical protein
LGKEWVRREVLVSRHGEACCVYLIGCQLERRREWRMEKQGTSDIFVESMDMTDMRPLQMSVVFFVSRESSVVPVMRGK